MKLIQTIQELRTELDALRKEGKTIGLVILWELCMQVTLRL